MTHTDVVIIGAGLAGLAAGVGAARRGLSCVVLERDAEPGGFARSFRSEGYTFDCSGHLLHLARPETRELVDSTSGLENWTELSRHSAIRMQDAWIPYPFQLHLAFAPDHVREECLAELPAAIPDWGQDAAELPFEAWIDGSLGAGIARWFMRPYNEKLSTARVGELTCEWLGRFVPRPSLEAIREGARSSSTEGGGYNATFLYPERGGIDLLWQGLAAQVPDLRTRTAAARIDPARRVVTTDAGDEIAYGRGLVLTTPLPAARELMAAQAPELDDLTRLRANEVTVVNLGLHGIAAGFPERLQWIYLPEERFTAYRVGIYSRFLPAMSPPGRDSVYVEISHAPGAETGLLVDAAVADLLELGLIDSPAAVEVARPVTMPHAYVIHDAACSALRERAHAWLRERDVLCAGRYARWEYASMEDALWQGLEAVDALAAVPASA